MTDRYRNTHIAPRVLALCQQPLSIEQIKEHFADAEQALVRHHVYNLVKRGQLRNVTEGKCGNGKVGRFVATGEVTREAALAALERAPLGDGGVALARAWGVRG